jgi:transposase InsO family protein
LGYTRQNYYKQYYDGRAKKELAIQVRQMVCQKRKLLPKVGTRKLHLLLGDEFHQKEIKLGRDGLFRLLRNEKLLIAPRRRYMQTTQSRHWLRKYPNLIRSLTPVLPEQVWVSDITYIRTQQEGYCYLSLVTDACSRKIMGYDVSRSLSAEHALRALKMAVANRSYPDRPVIHHSDRGIQYCSREYVTTAHAHQIQMSMTENGDPYENALAERMNRTIKEEFCLDNGVPSFEIAQQCIREAVDLYNSLRPHLALGGATPTSVHK